MLLHLFMYSLAYLCEAFLVEIQKKKLIIGPNFVLNVKMLRTSAFTNYLAVKMMELTL